MASLKINVLQVVPDMNSGGVERGTAELATYLKERSHNPYIASNGGAMVEGIEKLGVKHICLPVHSKNPLRMILNIFSLYKVIKKYNIDVVHARSRAPAWSSYFAAKLAGVIYVTTFHAAYSATHPIKRFYNSIMLYGDAVIAISEFIAKHIVTRYHFPKSRITVIPRGVDLTTFSAKNIDEKTLQAMRSKYLPHNLPDDIKVILLPARFTKLKGHLHLIKALSYIKKHKFYCIIVGKLSYNNYDYLLDLEKAIVDYKLENCVKLFTESESDMLHLYSISDIVICASQEPEGFGRVVVEAQALGKLIIATNIGAPIEIIEDGVDGFLSPSHDSTTFAEVIEHCITLSKEACDQIAKNALTKVKKKYTVEKMCKSTLEVYKQLIKTQDTLKESKI
jgi:glycosyltransferase involved in cell wall biosynthesis